MFKSQNRFLLVFIFIFVFSLNSFNVRAETQKAEHQPYMHGYNIDDILNWTPSTDAYAKYFRSRVPLAERIEPFADTQVNPNLSPLPQVATLDREYDASEKVYEFSSSSYDDAFCRSLNLFWQYHDIVGSWRGLPDADSTLSNMDYGVINIPVGAWTAAAHRNGVKSLACWFWPRSGSFDVWVQQNADGSFPVADKMIEMAEYFGFDGYFINQEKSISSSNAAKLMEMMKYLRDNAPEGFHIQWYDSLSYSGYVSYQNSFNSKNSRWIKDGNEEVCNSIFLNYWWDKNKINYAREHAISQGLDPYDVVYSGTNSTGNDFNWYDPKDIFPDGGIAKTSWALFCNRFWDGPNKLNYEKQFDFMEEDRVFWSGPKQNVAHTGRDSKYPKWDGVAHYIPARSVIGNYPFVTNFNTGHGIAYYDKGVKVGHNEWNNAIVQEILPSWQWWLTGNHLNVEYDYETVYSGGNSIAIQGDLGNESILKLFKTNLPIDNNVTFNITYKVSTDDLNSNLEVGFVFEDNPATTNYEFIGIAESSDWQTKEIPLNQYAGQNLAQIVLRLSGDNPNYKINIGEISLIRDFDYILNQPTGLEVEESYINEDNNQAEVFLKWDFDDSAWYYDIYAIHEDDSREWLGAITDEVYYIKHLNRVNSETETKIELIAVNHDRVGSSPSHAVFEWGESNPNPTPNPTTPASISFDLSNAFNGDGFSTESDKGNGNYDHGGWNYSAEAVESNLINHEIIFEGTKYIFGDFGKDNNNVIHCNGQNIDVADGNYTTIKMLGSSTSGNKTGTFKVYYDDGTYDDIQIAQKDWCTSNTIGEKVVMQMNHRHAYGKNQTIKNYIFAYDLSVNSDKQVVHIKLPQNNNMHILALTLEP